MRRAERSRVARGRRLAWVLRAALALSIVAGCAPHVTQLQGPEPALRAERYRLALAAREARGVAVDAEVLLWAEAPVGDKLPGAEGRLLLAGPDAFRLRVSSLFGTALDLAARGDSLTAYVPSRRRGLSLDAIRDSLGVSHPGALAFRTLAATWRPPGPAWERAAARGPVLEVTWLEGDDSLFLAIGSAGLPAWASFARSDGGGVRVDYQGWDASGGVAWPARFVLADRDGAFKVACKVSRVRFPAAIDSLRLAVPIPPDARSLTPAELRKALERLGAR